MGRPGQELPAASVNLARVTRARRLRDLLAGGHLEFLLEAHNALSARIVEESGFAGIWASGLALSAQFGVRDSNEASWTQVVDMVEFMVDSTSIPILLDGDTGYGNFNNLRRLIRKLEQRSVAGVCIEDKLFPKSNSLMGEHQQLCSLDEFCGKIKAGKDSQTDPDFCLIARVEALVAGQSLGEALRRAEAYRQAGADAILIHSCRAQPDEVLAFAREWAGRSPLVIVPTRYSSTPVEVFRRANIQLVIWANHMLRASIEAMQLAARRIKAEESTLQVEDEIAPLAEVFRLQGADELAAAEKLYLGRSLAAVLLAATRGDMNGLTSERPKGMIPIAGKPLLSWTVDALKALGAHPITVVAGWQSDAVELPGVERVVNDAYASSGELGSLAQAWEALNHDVLILYGDLLLRRYILRELAESTAEVTVVVDSDLEGRCKTGQQDYARCDRPDDRGVLQPVVGLMEISERPQEVHGRFIGAASFRAAGVTWLREALLELPSNLNLPDLLNHLVGRGNPVRVLYIHGHWLDVNTVEDLPEAGSFLA